MLNIEPQLEKNSFTFVQDNTINEMVQTNFHRFNTHVNVCLLRWLLLLSHASLQLIDFNHLLLYNFTTSPLKIDEPLSTFQF